MKKILIILALITGFGFCANAQSKSTPFSYEGISFEHEKGWKISNSTENGTTKIMCNRTKNKGLMFVPYAGLPQNNYITILKYKTDSLSDEACFKSYADQTKAAYAGTSRNVKSVGEITKRTINGIEAKSIDIEAVTYQRTYRFTKGGYDILIIISATKPEQMDADFAEILNSFSFKPE
jgi:hypothetical protein